jgi:acyl-CoA synthetase (AMP-forming)/AMP-acid ligase II/thioesterase domain-containing protein
LTGRPAARHIRGIEAAAAVCADESAVSIPDLLAGRARRAPEAVAVCAPGRPDLTYGGLCEHVAAVAGGLAAAGVGAADRVALVVPNGPVALTAFLGIASAAGCAPLNPAYREQELDFSLADVGASAVVVARTLASPVRNVARRRGIRVLELDVHDEAPAGTFMLEGAPPDPAGALPERAADEVALLLHTSGTTARPKLVPLRHRNLVASARAVAACLELTPADRCLNVMPLFHIHGIVGAALASLVAGASVACTDGFAATRFASWLEELEPTWYTAVPTMHQAVLARLGGDRGASSGHRLRLVRSSSAPLPPTVARGLEEAFGVPVIEAYGMTEAAHQMASNPLPPRPRKTGSVGLPAGPEIAVLGADGRILPPGALGEVGIRGSGVFAGYEANPEANAAAFTSGWFRTGDQGVVDDDGYLFLRGRLKELINRGGEKISPREIDEALLGHPAVAEAVAFGVPDERLGEDVAAAVVLRPGAAAEPAELQQFLAGAVADFKVPRRLLVVDAIPKGPTGKLQRIGLAAALGLDRPPGPDEAERPFEPPATPLESALAALWGRVLDVEPVGRHDDFFQLGGDSVLAAEVVARLGEAGVEREDVPLAALAWAPTVAALAGWLEELADTARTPLVPIRSEGGRPPLFFVHGGPGDVVAIAGLARFLDDEQPLVCLRSPVLDGEDPARDVTSAASRYAAEIASYRPEGALAVAGICTSGPVALEIARELQRRGREVSSLVLVDPTPSPREGDGRLRARLDAAARLRRPRVAARFARQRVAVLVRSGVGALVPGSPAKARSLRSERAMAAAAKRHRLVPYPGRVAVIHSDGFPTPRRLWEWVAAGGLEWREIPGDHPRLLLADRIAVLGETLAAALAEHGRAAS